MEGVRGRDMTPGRYRTEQNWIGPKGCSLEQASFIPIAPEHLQPGMDEWESFLTSTGQPDLLVQLALLHVEFEALHPFKDGNGRLGRMLIPLYLFQRKLLTSPDFYMSGYLEANREEYQERMRAVSQDGDWTGWCVFFLIGIQQQATQNDSKARSILQLYERLKKEVADLTRSQYSIRAVDFVFRAPIFSASLFSNDSSIPKPTANRILILLREAAIIHTLREAKGQTPGIYAFTELIKIAEG